MARCSALCAALLLLTGCAGTPEVHGNDKGGMIDWFATNESEVFAAASAHCARFAKAAKITSVRKEAGGAVLFDCR
jgi:hypothetical protein